MYKTEEVPESAFKSTHFLEFYKLKPNKKKFVKENIEMRIGLEYFIYSEKEQGWFRRELSGLLLPEKLFLNILMGYVRINYTEDDIQEIKSYTKRYNIKGYKGYLRQIRAEYGRSVIEGRKYYTDDWHTQDKVFRQLSKK